MKRSLWIVVLFFAACASDGPQNIRWIETPAVLETSAMDLGAFAEAPSFGFSGWAETNKAVWAQGSESRIPWNILQVRPRALTFEISSGLSAKPLAVEVFWNGNSLEKINLKPHDWNQIRIKIPESLQLLGQNWLLLKHTTNGQNLFGQKNTAAYRQLSLDGPALALDCSYARAEDLCLTPERPKDALDFWLKSDQSKISPKAKISSLTLQALVLRDSQTERPNLELSPLEPPPPTPNTTLPQFNPVQNVIIVLLDACHADFLGAYGNPLGGTPNLDRLTRHGILASHVFAQAAYTLASVGALMTGQSSLSNGLRISQDQLAPHTTTMAKIFAEHGYSTGAFSASPFVTKAYGLAEGFETFIELYRNSEYISQGRPARIVLQSFGHWLESKKPHEKVFAYIHLREPHQPYTPGFPWGRLFLSSENQSQANGTNSWISDIENEILIPEPQDIENIRAFYQGGLTSVDFALGQLLDKLEKTERLESTLFVILSDHGEAFFQHQRLTHNSTVHDEMLHIPLIFNMQAGPKKILEDLYSTADIGRLLFTMVGLQPQPTEESYQAVLAHTAGSPPAVAWRTKQYKCIGGLQITHPRLFDLLQDPAENTDLARQKPVTTRWFELQLTSYLEDQESKLEHQSSKPMSTLDAAAEEEMKALGYID